MLRQRGRGERETMRVREGILEEGRPDGVGRQVKGLGGRGRCEPGQEVQGTHAHLSLLNRQAARSPMEGKTRI